MNLLNIGSVAFDTIITPFGKVNKALGGSATYFSLAASYFVKPAVVAVVGEDFTGMDVLKKRGVDVSGIQKQKGKTFHWAGKYHFDLNTRDTLKTELGVFADFNPVLNSQQKNAEYIFLGNIHPKLQLNILKQMKKPRLVGLDSMNLWIETARKDLLKILSLVDVFVINDSEARELSKEHNIYKAAKKILKMMPSFALAPHPSTLIIKRGEYGLLMFQKNQVFHLPGLPLEDVVDPTGAGDSFAGGLFGFLAKSHNLSFKNFKQACVYGSAMASFCIQDFGTKKLQSIKPAEIKKRSAEFAQLSEI